VTNRDRLFALEAFGIKLGLDNIRTILSALDHPEQSFQSLHIAGTNGKGSAAAMVERALRAAGRTTGLYTSPHLDRIEERIAVDGQPIDARRFDEALADVFTAMDQALAAERLPGAPTFFEVTTALAFEVFRRVKVNVAVVEVGLGGRFDATNAITPMAGAITSIAFDHQRHLGKTLAEIATEKAGIAKPGVPLVVGMLPADARAAIERVAGGVGAPVVESAQLAEGGLDVRSGTANVKFVTPVRSYPSIRLALPGRHQIGNAAVAVRLLELADAGGIGVDADAIRVGLEDAHWPARLEWLRTADGDVLIDAAHNPAGAGALAAYLVEAGIAPIPIALAVMRDKDLDGMVGALAHVASLFVATEVSHERSYRAEDLASLLGRLSTVPVTAERDPLTAIRLAAASGGRAAAAGSIYFVGPARARLIESGAKPAKGVP
jgi:dihydrofolate synthase/folylpolyglutamate synthase